MASNEKAEKLRIAVTGFTGFIGSRLIKRLQFHKYLIIPLEGDVRNQKTWAKEFQVLYHCAAVVPQRLLKSSPDDFLVNVTGTQNALEACRRNNARMIFPSTCGVYKPLDCDRYRETDPISSLTAYAESKMKGEELCQSYATRFGVKSTVLRLFNVYGSGQNLKYIVPYLCHCALEGVQARVNHPDSSRDLIHINDVLDAFLCMLAGTDERFEIYNVGYGEATKVKDLIEMIGRVSGRKISYMITPQSQDDPQPKICADISKIQKQCNWKPRVDLETGIKEVFSGFIPNKIKPISI